MTTFAGNLVAGVLGSLIAAVLLLLGSAALSERVRWVLTATIGRMLLIDTEYVFKDRQSASSELASELLTAKHVRILTARGDELRGQTYLPLYNTPRRDGIFILLPNPERAEENAYDWIAQNEREMIAADPAMTIGLLRSQIRTNLEFLKPHVKPSVLEVRMYSLPHLARVILTERCAYMAPYQSDGHGWSSPVIKYRRGGPMYDWLERLFGQYWDASLPVNTH